mmetsp:Transcript_149785/g.286988  ORF Transcript_149785/g.286988 Transcript_149785/m.286988 type:complete len:98 (-) Transcript_149785:149-442(-)
MVASCGLRSCGTSTLKTSNAIQTDDLKPTSLGSLSQTQALENGLAAHDSKIFEAAYAHSYASTVPDTENNRRSPHLLMVSTNPPFTNACCKQVYSTV